MRAQALLAALLCAVTLLWLDAHLVPWLLLVSVLVALVITAHNGSDEMGMSDQGETIAGLQFSMALAALNSLNDDAMLHCSRAPRRSIFWRPQLLCYVWTPPAAAAASAAADEEEDRGARSLLNLAHYLKEGKGLCIVGSIIPPGLATPGDADAAAVTVEAKLRMRRLALEEDLAHFTDATCAQPFGTALQVMLSCTGIGAMRPNTVLIGYDAQRPYEQQRGRAHELHEALVTSLAADRSILLYLGSEPVTPKLSIAKGLGDTTIDVWWFDTSTNGVLPLMLCHLLCRHPDFDKVKVRIFSPYWRGKGPAFQRAQTADPATLMHVIEAMSLRETSLQREASLRRSSLVEESADQSPHDNHAEQQHKPSLRSMSTVGSLPADKYRSLDGLHEHSAWSSVTSELSRERSAEEHREHMLNFLQVCVCASTRERGRDGTRPLRASCHSGGPPPADPH